MDKIISFITTNSLATVVSIFLAFIAYKQWKTEEEKKRLELFDKRFEVYQHFMLNPVWQELFYQRDKIRLKNNILDKLKPPTKDTVDKSYFLFPKRVYDKICLTYSKLCYLCGQQEVINEVRDFKKDEKLNCEELANILEKELMEEKILQLKNEHEVLLNDFHDFMAIEQQITIWRLLKNIICSVWDFIIPYNSKSIKQNRDNYEKLLKEQTDKLNQDK